MDRRTFVQALAVLGNAAWQPARAAGTPIRMAYFDNYPPLSMRDAHGRMVGALLDGVALVGRSAGLTFENHGYPWVRAQALVEAGKLDMSLGIFKAMPDVRREPFFRFSLMVARAAKDNAQPRKTTSWSALDGETLISLSPGHPHQQLIDKHLSQAGVKARSGPTVNLLDTQIALVEAEEGIAIIPSFGLPACRNRKITTSQLINPVVRFDFHMISRRGTELPPGAEEFIVFLKNYIATWAGRAGVL